MGIIFQDFKLLPDRKAFLSNPDERKCVKDGRIDFVARAMYLMEKILFIQVRKKQAMDGA